MKYLLITMLILWSSTSAFANCTTLVEKTSGKNSWLWIGQKYKDVDRVRAAKMAGCNFSQEFSCVYLKTPTSALSCAIAVNVDLEVIAELIEAKADVTAVDSAKRTPLSYAVEIGNVQVVSLLLKHGANDYPKIISDAKSKNPNVKIKNDSLYAIAAHFYKTNENFDICKQPNFQEFSKLFYITQAMHLSDTKDSKLKNFYISLDPIRTKQGFEEVHKKCPMYAGKAVPQEKASAGAK